MPRVEEIVLTEFRGATGTAHILLDPTKRLALFYGENGTGKSTLIDGLDVALTGGVGSLAEVSTGGTRAKFLRSLGAQEATRAAVKVDGEWWEATLAGSAVSRTTPGPQIPVHVLRRRQIQRLIEATDSQKYEVIEPCLGIAGAAKAEDALTKALTAQAKLLKGQIDRQDQSRKALESLCAGAGGPVANAVEWSRRIVAVPRPELQAESDRLETIERRWETADEAVTALLAAITHAQDAAGELRRHEEGSAPSSGLSGEEAASLVELLETARDHIASHPADRCPVCAVDADSTALIAALDQRMEELSVAQERRKTGERLRMAVTETDRQAAMLAERVMASGSELLKLLADSDSDPIPQDAASVTQTMQTMEAKKRTIYARREVVQRRLADINGLATNLRLYDEAAEAVENLQAKVNCLRAASEIVAGGRKAYVQRVLDELQADVVRMYALVHPDEEAAAGRMQLDEAKSGSLRHTVRLGRHEDVVPAPYFSESHQDTLAICILFAVAKRQGGKDSILLLDDVLMSVDNRHMDRLMALLIGEIESFGHIVMTTHSLRFFQKFREVADLADLADLVELRYLLPHGQEVGIRVGDPPGKPL